MKIQRIGIESILHFNRYQVDLGDENALHIFYGPNEAGKSTLLKLMINVLFGGKITDDLKPYFDSRSKIEAVLLHETLPPIHYYRKRRYSQLIPVDLDGNELDENRLFPYFNGYQKEQYALLFGFDHERLRSGGESLLQSGGHAGISLFESGGGVQYLQQILQQLNIRTKELVDPGFRKGSSKLLNKSWKHYQESIKAVREKGLRGEDWHKKVKEIDEKKRMIAKLQKESDHFRREIAKQKRAQRVWKPYWERQKILSELETLNRIPTLSDETIQHVTNALEQYQEATEEKGKGKVKYSQKKGIFEQIHYDRKILRVGTEINTLNEKLQQYTTRLMKEIPEDTRSMNEWMEEARGLLTSIAPTLSMKEVEQLRIPYSKEEEILSLADDLKRLELSHQSEMERMNELSIEYKKIQEELKKMNDSIDTAPIEHLIRQVQREGDIDGQIETVNQEREKGEKAIRRIQNEQNIWTDRIETLIDRSIPLQETIEKYYEEWNKLEIEREGIQQQFENAEQQLNETINRLEQIELGGYVPIEEDLRKARQNRNDRWTLVKNVWLKRSTSQNRSTPIDIDPESLANTFEQSMEEADKVADLMRKESDRSAKRANLLLQKQQTEKMINELKQKRSINEQHFTSLKEKWEKEWEISGIEPKSPREMKEWLNAFYRPILEEWKKVNEVDQRLHELLNKKSLLQKRLKEAAKSIGYKDYNEEDHIEVLLQKLEFFVKKAEENRIHYRNWKKRKEDLAYKITEQKERVEQLNEKLNNARQKWEKIRLAYPHLGENIEIAKSTIEKLRKLFQIVSNIHRIERSIESKKEDCKDFENRVADLAKRLSDRLSDFPSIENYVRTLRETYELEKEKKTKADEIEKQIKEIEKELLENERKEEEYKQIVQSYMETYHCSTIETLHSFVHKAIQKTELQKKLQETEERLMEAGDFLPIGELETEVESIENPELIPAQIEQLEEHVKEIETRIKQQREQLWQLEREFSEMNETKTDANMYAQKAESYLVEVDQYWNEYLRFELAKRLLQRAIEQYRRKNETNVIKIASRFFQQLTIHQYKELIIDYEENVPVIVAIDQKGRKRKVDEMSDGTRDQLYLALRLAFVETHLTDSEPLPLMMDDIFVHFDDERTKATLKILHQLASKTQILYFTHHQFIVDCANGIGGNIRIHHIENKQMEHVDG